MLEQEGEKDRLVKEGEPDSQVHERHGEVDCLLPLVGDCEVCDGQVGLLGKHLTWGDYCDDEEERGPR